MRQMYTDVIIKTKTTSSVIYKVLNMYNRHVIFCLCCLHIQTTNQPKTVQPIQHEQCI